VDSNTSEQCETTLSRSRFGWFVALVCLICPSNAFAGYSSLYIFGDSLSDSGNNAVVLAPNVTPVPISGNSFIPTYPYASGRYTNGQTWAQTLASALGLNASPSLLGGTDYAFGGAQTGPATPNALPNGLLIPLTETALRQAGVEPTVISSADDAVGSVPLTHAGCVVVKLNGDYLDTRIRNTPAELAAYDPRMNQYLDRVLDEFGLIVLGWSADWDDALRDAIARCPTRRFTTWWAARGGRIACLSAASSFPCCLMLSRIAARRSSSSRRYLSRSSSVRSWASSSPSVASFR
jgi:hypothetical protein